MTDEPTPAPAASLTSPWKRVYLKAFICLVVGLASGYLIRGAQSPSSPASPAAGVGQPTKSQGIIGGENVASATQPRQPAGTQPHSLGEGRMPTLGEMKRMADTQAAPLLEKLKDDPNNIDLLGQVAAIYYTTHQFKEAEPFYERSVNADPKNVALRVKWASSLYRGGDVDGSIAELNQALKIDPKDANALFDLGVIELRGKQDSRDALAAWQLLLKSNPQLSEDRRATVQQLMAQVLTMLSDQHGIQGVRSDGGH